MGSFGLQVRAFGPRGSFERWYERPPVFVGRRPSSDCILDTQGVSKTHACIDVRARAVCVRDCGSANGTTVGGIVAVPHEWLRAGALGEVVEIRISEWTLHVSALAVGDGASVGAATMTLTDLLEPQRSQRSPLAETHGAVTPPPGPHEPARPVPLPPAQVATALLRPSSAPTDALQALHADVIRTERALYEGAARLLAESPPGLHRALCDQLATSYPRMAADPSFVALFRHYGWSPAAGGGPAPSLAASSLEQMQELARWYLGPDRSLTSEAELVAFKEHQRKALDELLIGFVRLVAGLDKFEQQMALRADAGAPRTAAELIRQLLDWRLPAEDALHHVRTSFADLMMHQVALLHGVMRGVKSLLTALAPATIEAAAKQRRKGSILPFGGPDPWALYKERHADFSDEENERFRVLFGADFAEEYRAVTREARKDPP